MIIGILLGSIVGGLLVVSSCVATYYVLHHVDIDRWYKVKTGKAKLEDAYYVGFTQAMRSVYHWKDAKEREKYQYAKKRQKDWLKWAALDDTEVVTRKGEAERVRKDNCLWCKYGPHQELP